MIFSYCFCGQKSSKGMVLVQMHDRGIWRQKFKKRYPKVQKHFCCEINPWHFCHKIYSKIGFCVIGNLERTHRVYIASPIAKPNVLVLMVLFNIWTPKPFWESFWNINTSNKLLTYFSQFCYSTRKIFSASFLTK